MNENLVSRKSRHLYLDVVRVIAIISITLNHAVSRSFNIYQGHLDEFNSHSVFYSLGESALYVFSRIGVPLFLMISGALLLNKKMEDEKDVKRFYKHNLLSLFITTEIWYVIMYWFIILFSPSNTLLETQGFGKAVVGMFKTMLFIDQTTMPSMWYMPMILCLYATIPFVAIVKNKLQKGSPILLLPIVLVFAYNMVFPAVNMLLNASGKATHTTVISQANLLSIYYIYILIGCFINSASLQKIKDWQILGIGIVSFAVCVAVQLYFLSKPVGAYLYYEFPLLPICAGAMFEFFRRKAGWFKIARRPITYLSKITFAIFFVHILIMSAMYWFMSFAGWNPYLKMAFLEGASLGASVLIIFPLSKIPLFRKYLFLIKG